MNKTADIPTFQLFELCQTAQQVRLFQGTFYCYVLDVADNLD